MQRSSRVANGLSGREHLDFDKEAKKIFDSLKLDPNRGRYNPLDPIWRHPVTGATLFVGNVKAASDISILDQNSVTHVVNCTNNMECFHQKTGRIVYLRFDISGWRGEETCSGAEKLVRRWREVKGTGETGRRAVIKFTTPVLQFVGEALSCGKNVMVHCAAGAHRAGTTGVLLLMHFLGLDSRHATALAQKLRPIIQPIGTLPQLLEKIDDVSQAYPPRSRFPPSHFPPADPNSDSASHVASLAESATEVGSRIDLDVAASPTAFPPSAAELQNLSKF